MINFWGLPRVLSGKVLKVYSVGVAFIEADTGKSYSFTFDKITGWKGERPKDMKRFSQGGFVKGITIRFTLDSKDNIFQVFP